MKYFKVHNDSLRAEFSFKSFKQSLNFVVLVGELAEDENHHPDIDIRYTKVGVILSTHDRGNIVTEKDYSLAEKIENRFDEFLLSADFT
ncbi:MAG: 4a-hydroxytetrahydrobiopterin dehydratase [Flavobacteriia bacterium]|nr:4a-hydroxytetrahydrobiopterin dehydratase [Flavobacteriia bacterium]